MLDLIIGTNRTSEPQLRARDRVAWKDGYDDVTVMNVTMMAMVTRTMMVMVTRKMMVMVMKTLCTISRIPKIFRSATEEWGAGDPPVLNMYIYYTRCVLHV